MMDYETATQQAEAISKKAIEDYQRDIRFRRMVDSCVSFASQERGRRIDPERADREAHDLAIRASMLVLATVYLEDAEIHALRIERDHYKKIAEKALLISPLPAIVLKHG